MTEEIKEKPKTGCFVSGFFVEGARWCHDNHVLTESRPKELFTGSYFSIYGFFWEVDKKFFKQP